MIEFQDISFSYTGDKDKNSLRHISLTISEGEVVLLCGASGCGKTTLTRLVNGLIPHYYEGALSGACLLDGKSIAQMPLYETALKVGSVFQNPRSQFFNIDTTSEVAFGCENQGMPETDILQHVDLTVAEFKIKNLMDRNIFALSGGEKQKVACASVAAVAPDVYVLDEPSSNLDIKSIQDLRDVIALWKKQKKTILIAEHRLYYLMDLADRVIFMENGQVVRDMPIAKFQAIPEEEHQSLGLRKLKINELAASVNPEPLDAQLQIKDFNFSYRQQEALNIPSLCIPAGSIIAVVGSNGAGKTTFSRCLCGLEKKAKGMLLFNGKAYSAKQRLRLCYMVFQDVNHQLFTEDVLSELLLSIDDESADAVKKAEQILDSLNLMELKARHPMSLSGGQKQRVAIGSAIASNREIIVYDEPTSGLDYRHMLEVADNLKKLAKLEKTQFIVTHDPELIAQCCNYFIFIEHGRAVWSGGWTKENHRRLSAFFTADGTNQSIC